MRSQTQDVEALGAGEMFGYTSHIVHYIYRKFSFGYVHSIATNRMYLAFAAILETKIGNFSRFCDWLFVRLLLSTTFFWVSPTNKESSACVASVMRIVVNINNYHSLDFTYSAGYQAHFMYVFLPP